MAEHCALSLRLGVRFSGIDGASGVLGGLTSRRTGFAMTARKLMVLALAAPTHKQ
jgi:hypothetical protein